MPLMRPAVLAATLTALALLGVAPAALVGSGPVVRCEPCDARALAQCTPPPPAPECAELVREPGCGCCLTCALLEGQPCGVYTERCGAGLRCHPQPGEPRPLQALLDGRGVCTNTSAAGRLSAHLLPAPGKPPVPGASPQRPEGGARGHRTRTGSVAAKISLPSPPQVSDVGGLKPQEASVLSGGTLRSLSVLCVRSACKSPSAFGESRSDFVGREGADSEVGARGEDPGRRRLPARSSRRGDVGVDSPAGSGAASLPAH